MCSGAEDDSGFVACDLSGTELSGNMWYSPSLNALIYGKEEIDLQPIWIQELFDDFVSWLGSLFSRESGLSDEAKFIASAQNFRDVYLLSYGEQKVRATREVHANQQMLVAEYEGFTTPICDYVQNLKLPAEAESELLEKELDMEDVICSVEAGIQKVEAVAGLDFLWPQLTGKLRVAEN
jgi:hypothetical protein